MTEDLFKDSEGSEGRDLYRTLSFQLIKKSYEEEARAELVELRALYQLALYGNPAQYQPNYGAGSGESSFFLFF